MEQKNVLHKEIILSNGRITAYTEYGNPAGIPIVCFHGMPGSRLLFRVMEQAAFEHGLRLIAPDRPGYGLSEAASTKRLVHYADDIIELADSLGLAEFGVLGVSGGGPYAMACAYKLTHRLTIAAVMSGIGPLNLRNSTAEMVFMNRLMFNLGRFSPALVGFLLPRLLKMQLPSMEKHVQEGTSPTADISPEAFAIVAADQQEAIHTGGNGIKFDMTMLWQPWGFDFEAIQTQVYLWHGEADNLAPPALAHHIADHVPHIDAVFYPGEGHIDPLTKHIDEIVAKLAAAIQAKERQKS